MGINFSQEGTQYHLLKFNVTGVEVNKFIEALKYRSQKMGQNSHPTSGILTTADANGTDLNLFNNYGQTIKSEITKHKQYTLIQIQGRRKTMINFITV